MEPHHKPRPHPRRATPDSPPPSDITRGRCTREGNIEASKQHLKYHNLHPVSFLRRKPDAAFLKAEDALLGAELLM